MRPHRNRVLWIKARTRTAVIEQAISMHRLRHTYASMPILLDRKLPEISRYWGHADVAVTMKVYTHS
jgi:integrase